MRPRHRRNLLQVFAGGVAFATVTPATATPTSKIALLHLAPLPGEIAANRTALEQAVRRAAAHGARLIVSPELAVSGYGFRDLVGTDWIASGQSALFAWAGALARETNASLVLGTPEAAVENGALFNSMVLFAQGGTLVGRHRKINALRVGSESWSTPGDRPTVLTIDGIGRVGFFVCADMYSTRLVEETAANGVDLLLSAAAWAPGHHGPDGEWERASAVTGRPVLVCNRTGKDVLDFEAARSVTAVDGRIAFSHASPEPGIVLVDWTADTRRLSNWRLTGAT
ncbi:MAG: putative carbon-nitrogen hydrolase [Rhodospirillaceae bacterium]|nr:MAG: putative carbon-nitrogen hydrolase [Rhodospirillaceae bacterium]